MIGWRTSANARKARAEMGDYTRSLNKGVRPTAADAAAIVPQGNEGSPHSYLYGLAEDPFRLTPDPRFCLGHPSYQRARGCLEYALLRAEGFVVVSGMPGTGKTMLINDMLADLAHEPLVVGPLLSSQLDTEELLPMVALSFDISVEGRGKVAILGEIRKFIVGHRQRGCRTIVIVDEAQALSVGALEELRLLSNLRQGEDPLVQVFLLGQETLWERVRHPSLAQLHQRVIAACHLEPLDAEQTAAYVRYRLEAAGWKGDPNFGADVFPLVHWFSGGIPRRINTLCSRLLLAGYEEEKHALGRDEVLGAIEALRSEGLAALPDEPPPPSGHLETGREVTGRLTSLTARAPSHQPPISPEEIARGQSDTTATEVDSLSADAHRLGNHEADKAAAAPRVRAGGTGHLLEALNGIGPPVSSVADATKVMADTIAPTRLSEPETVAGAIKATRKPSLAARRRRWFLPPLGWLLPFLVVYSAFLMFLFWWDRQSWVEPHPVAQEEPAQASPDLEKTAATFVRRAQAAQKEGRLVDALAALEEGLQAAPGEPALSRLKAVIGKDHEQALRQQREVEKLTALAESQIAGSRYGEPADNNAIATFRRILALDPANLKARQRLHQLAELFNQAARDKQQIGQLERSLSLIDLGLGAEPQHEALKALRVEVTRKLREEQRQQQQQAQEKRIAVNALIARAERQLASFQLTQPPGDNAYESYLAARKLAPSDERVRAGMQRIADRYVVLARSRQKSGELKASQELIRRGLTIVPNHSGLLALNTELTAEHTAQPRAQP